MIWLNIYNYRKAAWIGTSLFCIAIVTLSISASFPGEVLYRLAKNPITTYLLEGNIDDKRRRHLGIFNNRIVIMNKSSLPKLNLKDFDFSDAIFDGSDFSNADFSGSTLTGASFRNTLLKGAKFYCPLIPSRLDCIDLDRVDFFAANLSNAHFDGVTMVGASLEAATLQAVNFDNVDLTAANLRFATLRDAIVRSSSLVAASLDGANTEGATFLLQTDFSGASLLGVAGFIPDPDALHLDTAVTDVSSDAVREKIAKLYVDLICRKSPDEATSRPLKHLARSNSKSQFDHCSFGECVEACRRRH